ncbi:hypothetical protein CYMTET_12648 [Cymbomonas tetramitiformis]|uniref:RING-type domain-containing protein n=1 Tax=Cymbomonas tetramitiformis TaxID=36881 RepID=A0AAE0GK90_9CHLO|nr:hypothetical protein CYMTET_12648 [Cymbomonas tetramitiformis]
MSLADIVCDILVAIEFYNNGHRTFFFLSIVIFTLAQLSYSFLFVATYGRKLSNLFKALLFALVLPWSQLVPLFAWVESLHFAVVDTVVTAAGLTPTEDAYCGSKADSLWVILRRKHQRHAGFLVEALVEAIPQCVLQTVAVVLYGTNSPVNLLSITLSLAVICSKGWVLSYSLHRPTCLFNLLCVSADCVGVFATATWIFSTRGAAVGGFFDFAEYPFDEMLVALWLLCLALALPLATAGGLALLGFTMVDDHLKIHWKHHQYAVQSVWFNIYVVRGMAWVLALLPCTVLYVSLTFTTLPVFLFNSLDHDHGVHAAFYRPLFQILEQPLGKSTKLERGAVVNNYLQQVEAALPVLQWRLKHLCLEGVNEEKRAQMLEKWAKMVGWTAVMPAYKPACPNLEQIDTMPALELNAIAPQPVSGESANAPSISQWQKRMGTVLERIRRKYLEFRRNCLSKSFVLRALLETEDCSEAPVKDWTTRTLQGIAVACLCVICACALLWAPLTCAFITLKAFFPILMLAGSPGEATLPAALTFAYIGALTGMMCLLPLVHSFQISRVDLHTLEGLPDVFYDAPVVTEIRRRVIEQCAPETLANLTAAPTDSKEANAFDECSVCCDGIKEKEMMLMLPWCGHLFHEHCIRQWLEHKKTCPNCRCPALAQ